MFTAEIVKEFGVRLTNIRTGIESGKVRSKRLHEELEAVEADSELLQDGILKLRKAHYGGVEIVPSATQKVSPECAEWFTAVLLLGANRFNKLRTIPSDRLQRLLAKSEAIVGVTRTALTTTDVPMPTAFAREIVALVVQYGQARKFCTTYPLSRMTKLPRLKTSPAFSFQTMSVAVTEVSPQVEFVTFSPEKSGGIVRLPTEIDEDSFAPVGQFIADYVARETAKFEDVVVFLADGTGTYKSMVGILQGAVTLGKKIVLATTKTKPTDIALADLRALRGLVASEALVNGSYFFHPTFDAHLRSLNTFQGAGVDGAGQGVVTFKPYEPSGPKGPTLDGFPVRWVNVLPTYDQSAHVSQIQGVFGDIRYEYLGLRDDLSIDISREVYFSTDEIGIRALERFAIGQMSDTAWAAIQLAAS